MKRTMLLLAIGGLVAAPVLAGEIHPRVVGETMAVAVTDAVDPGAPDFPRARHAVTAFLSLTADQAAAWDDLLTARESAVAPLRDQLKSTEDQLKELLNGSNPDPSAVGTLVISGKTLREGIQAAHKVYVDAFEAMLTMDQRARLGAVRHAAQLAPVLPAFGVMGLLPPGPPPAQ